MSTSTEQLDVSAAPPARPLWPLLLALMVWLVVAGASLAYSISQTGGRLVYGLDDAYIHMALSANFARSGTWGINPGEFAAASSSPLYTLLLAGCYAVGGVGTWAPLVIGAVSAASVVVLCWYALAPFLRDARWLAAALVGIVLATPLPYLTTLGMEHPLHVALAMAFVLSCGRLGAGVARIRARTRAERRSAIRETASGEGAVTVWGSDEGARPGETEEVESRRRMLVAACVLAALMTACRFEGLFVAFPAALLLLARRRYGLAVAVGLAAWAPVAAYAAYASAHGGAWLPNSVLLKGQTPAAGQAGSHPLDFLASACRLALRDPRLLVLAAGSVAALVILRRDPRPQAGAARAVLFVSACAAVIHMELAGPGYRYAAYLVCLMLVGWVMAANLLLTKQGLRDERTVRRPCRALARCFVLATAALAVHAGFAATRRATAGPREVYRQQFQMAQFLNERFPGAAVAVNDIGAVSFLGRGRVIDLWGLGTQRVFDARRRGEWNPAVTRQICDAEHVRLAIVYDFWFPEGLPASWRRAGQWTSPPTTVVGGPTVTFYATSETDRRELVEALRLFKDKLPSDVRTTLAE
jgi:hypothetical protein